MNKIIIILISLLSYTSFADDRCRFSDTVVEYHVSTFNISPPIFVARQNDRICIKVIAVDNGKSIRIEGMPIYLKAYPNKPAETSFVVRKTGEFKVICTGCANTSKLIVESGEKFDKEAENYYRGNSFENRNPHYSPNPSPYYRPSGPPPRYQSPFSPRRRPAQGQ